MTSSDLLGVVDVLVTIMLRETIGKVHWHGQPTVDSIVTLEYA